MRMRIKTIQTSNKKLKYFRCRDGKRTETRIGMDGICITHSCIPPLEPLCVACTQCTVECRNGYRVIQIPSIPILVSVLFPSLHLKYFRIKFLLLVLLGCLTSEGITCVYLVLNSISATQFVRTEDGKGNPMQQHPIKLLLKMQTRRTTCRR